MKRILILFIAFSAIYFQSIGQTPIPAKPNPEKLVNDYANILNDQEEKQLEVKLRDIDNKTGIQIAAVSIQTLDGADAGEFSTNIIRTWGVGHKDNRGLVILISMDRKWAISTGYGIEGDLPDVTCSHLGESYLIPNLRNKAYYQAFNATVDATMDVLGMMSWDDRVQQRAIKAAVEAKQKEQRLLAEKADREAREKRNQERWDSFVNILGSIALFALPFALIFFFYAWYKEWKKEKARRLELKNLCSHTWLDVHGTMVNIKSFCEEFPKTVAIYPKWVYAEVEGKYKSAKSLNTKFLSAHAEIKQFTTKKVRKAEQSIFNSLYEVVSTTAKKMTEIHSFAIDGIFKEYREEEANKAHAIERYNAAVKSCESTCDTLIKQQYNLDSYQHIVDELIQAFKNCVKEEEKLGKNFDNEVEEIVTKIAALEKRINSLPNIQKTVSQKLPTYRQFIKNVNDNKIEAALTLLAKKYQKDAWETITSKWNGLLQKSNDALKQLDTVESYNTMKQQRFEDAHDILEQVIVFYTQLEAHKNVILALDQSLITAKKAVLLKKTDIDELVVKVKILTSDSDVDSSTERTANTLLTKVVNFSNALIVSPEPDWIANEDIAISLYEQLKSVCEKMEEEIADAEEARAEAIREANRPKPSTYIGGGGSSGGSSWSGFGGGSGGGGGANGSW